MSTQLQDRYINYFRYSAALEENLCSFWVKYDGKGAVLQNCAYCWHTDSGQIISPADFKARATRWASPGTLWYCILEVLLEDGPDELPKTCVTFKAMRDHVFVEWEGGPGLTFVLSGELHWGQDAEHSTFALSLDRPGYGLRCGCGPAVSRWDDALLDRADGSVVRLDARDRVRLDWSWERGCYTFEARGSLGMQAFPRYFEDRFQINYRPVCKTNGYPTPPAGWMTWYAVKFDACEQAVLDNTRLQKQLLADYGADTVWVDWEWYHNGFDEDMTPGVSFFHPDPHRYPHGLDYLARRIEQAGFTPALWIAPTHEPIETDFIRQNPDAVLVDRVIWCGRFFFDISHPKFLTDYLPRAIRQVPRWGYRALKWDCLPFTMIYADRVHESMYDSDSSSYQSFRRAMQVGRDILGDDFYMLSCSGSNDRTVLSACDIFDGARIGGDIFRWEEFTETMVARLMRLYPYHNIVFYCDPDNVVLRPEFNDLHQARSRISLVSLLGLPTTFGDDLRQLPMERVELLRRGLPTLDIHPMELRELELERDTLVVNLLINRPFARWNVAGVFNLADRERTLTVELLEDLGLEEGEYLVYEYWTDTFHGTVSGSLTLTLPPCACAVLSVRRRLDRLQLVSTSRHISQGGADLLGLDWHDGVLSGTSRVVRGDPYTITAYDPQSDRLVKKTLHPEATGPLEWSLRL